MPYRVGNYKLLIVVKLTHENSVNIQTHVYKQQQHATTTICMYVKAITYNKQCCILIDKYKFVFSDKLFQLIATYSYIVPNND